MSESNNSHTGRPHTNDDIRWFELFTIAAVVYYDPPQPIQEPTITVDEFMDYVEKKLRRHGIQVTSWRTQDWKCDRCGKEANFHQCIDKVHEYFCWKCRSKIEFGGASSNNKATVTKTEGGSPTSKGRI